MFTRSGSVTECEWERQSEHHCGHTTHPEKVDDFLCNCPTTPEHLRPWMHERIPGISRNLDDPETYEFADVLGTFAEDLHMTRCAQVCFTGTEDDQAEQRDRGTIDEVLGDPDMEHGGNAPEETDREADLLEHSWSPRVPTLYVQPRSGNRCVRDHRLNRHALLDFGCRLYGSYVGSSMG